MPSLFDETSRKAILTRLGALTPEAKARWGSMDVGKMLCHCSDQLRSALGDLETAPAKGLYTLAPMKWLIIKVMPWPKGVATATEFFTAEPEAFARDRDALIGLIERFAAQGPTGTFLDHPLFGSLSPDLWSHLAHRHLDHHLRQFGV